MLTKTLFLLFIALIETSVSFWPPAYKIHLNQSETFIISDMFDDDDAQDFNVDDEEIIKEADMERFLHLRNSTKYYRIHRIALRRNRAANASPQASLIENHKPTEMPYEKQDYPEYAGFFNNKSELETSDNVYYANEMAKLIVEKKIEELRKEKTKLRQKNADYDYASYKKEYADFVKVQEKSKDVLKYTEIPEEESLKDSIKNVLTFKNTTNCTKEEMKGIGVASLKCFYHDVAHLKKEKDKPQLLKRLLKVALIWFLVYACIAIPCWCTKGWCCCCFQCKFCKPRRRIDEVKKFIANNPLGVLCLEDGKVVTYKPTIYEEHAQKRLEQAIMKL